MSSALPDARRLHLAEESLGADRESERRQKMAIRPGKERRSHRLLTGDSSGKRLDVFVADALAELSRSHVKRLIEGGAITVNGERGAPSHRVRRGDRIEVELAESAEPRGHQIEPEEIPLDIVYEDDDLLVVNKERGMVVHPAAGNWSGTLVNALLHHCGPLSERSGRDRPGIVHRLDRDTSGLLVVAKTDFAHASLGRQIQRRTAKRAYKALVWGDPKWRTKRVDVPIGRHPMDRKKMAVLDDAALKGRSLTRREAVTELEVTERFGTIAALEAHLLTGRTHQIRVHCAYLEHPVVGDPVYGRPRKTNDPEIDRRIAELDGQALHAFSLEFTHPVRRERMHFEAPLPPDIEDLLSLLRDRLRGVRR
jgi:23S rRNA pseudouridine1911/1915/1917 synthase